jgi:predicted aldo/keto reductase-like oxidoreductase
VKSQDQLRLTSIQWVLQNPDMHTVCVAFSDFELVDKVIPLSGTKMSEADHQFLEEYRLVYSNQYCRHGCTICNEHCPLQLPVSTIMRYAYYYKCQGREKDAMQKYASLENLNATHCISCDAPCLRACPYGVQVQANLMQAHSLLTLA